MSQARAYYNEWDKYAAAWLRNLIAEGLIADGDVDERSIADVTAGDLAGYTQVHFFAGIGGWSRALRLAGWPDSRPVWTGSCPCQPFSAAGKRKGTQDERHLWPEMFRLIAECRPVRVFGEQVESAVGHGWLDGVFTDLEAEAYTCGAVVLGAHSVGAPHIRQRLWWVAYAGRGCDERGVRSSVAHGATGEAQGASQQRERCGADAGSSGTDGRLAVSELHAGESRRASEQPTEGAGTAAAGAPVESGRCCVSRGLEHAPGNGRQQGRAESGGRGIASGRGDCGLGDTRIQGSQGYGELGWVTVQEEREGKGRHTTASGFWHNTTLIPCLDGKTRRLEPGIAPLAHGVPARVGKLRAYGNAIVPEAAAEFIRACEEVLR